MLALKHLHQHDVELNAFQKHPRERRQEEEMQQSREDGAGDLKDAHKRSRYVEMMDAVLRPHKPAQIIEKYEIRGFKDYESCMMFCIRVTHTERSLIKSL